MTLQKRHNRCEIDIRVPAVAVMFIKNRLIAMIFGSITWCYFLIVIFLYFIYFSLCYALMTFLSFWSSHFLRAFSSITTVPCASDGTIDSIGGSKSVSNIP